MLDSSSLAARFKRMPLALRLALLLPGVALGVYFAATSSGPWRWLYEFQASLHDGRYRPVTTVVATIVICVAPFWTLAWFVAGRFPERGGATSNR